MASDVVTKSLDVLQSSLTIEIDRLDKESTRHKHLHRRGQTGVIILTSVTTIVAATALIVSAERAKYVQFAVVCLTAVSAGLASWNEMRNARRLWQHEREVYYTLVDIRRELNFVATTRGLGTNDLDRFYGKIAGALGSSSQKWARIQEASLPEPSKIE